MTHASLFSGIGGAEIAASWLGWENLFHCEINPFRRLSKIMRYDAKRDFNAAIRSIRRLKTDVNLCNDARQDEFGNDADIINALLLLIVDRAGDDDLTAFPGTRTCVYSTDGRR